MSIGDAGTGEVREFVRVALHEDSQDGCAVGLERLRGFAPTSYEAQQPPLAIQDDEPRSCVLARLTSCLHAVSVLPIASAIRA